MTTTYCESWQVSGSSRLHSIGPASLDWEPDITPESFSVVIRCLQNINITVFSSCHLTGMEGRLGMSTVHLFVLCDLIRNLTIFTHILIRITM